MSSLTEDISQTEMQPIRFSSLVRLALPISLGFLGMMLMNTVDLICVGKIGATEMAAVGLGGILWHVSFVIGLGLSMATEFVVSYNFGARKHTECRRALIQGLWLVSFYSLIGTFLPIPLLNFLPTFVKDPEQSRLAQEYTSIVLLSIWPGLIYHVCRCYLQSLGRAMVVFYAMVFANVFNLVADLALILGWWGLPKWGVFGAAIATTFSRYFMALCLLAYIWYRDPRLKVLLKKHTERWPHFHRQWDFIKIGFPISMHMTFEGGMFTLVTALSAVFGVLASAAHQAVINIAATSFMIPLGISSATTVLVGQSYGRKNLKDLKKSGRMGLGLGMAYMLCSCILLLLFPKFFLGIYTHDPQVIEVGLKIIFLAAIFQISDGVQIVASGALRGIGETKVPMMLNFLGYWVIGLPIAWYFAFIKNYEVTGLWMGLVAGLVTTSVLLFYYWLWKVRRFHVALSPENLR